MREHIISILVAMNLVMFTIAASTAYENSQLKADITFVVKDLKDRQYKIDDLNASNHRLEDELVGYKSANEALIEHCEPKSLTKAIKATPLPPLVIL